MNGWFSVSAPKADAEKRREGDADLHRGEEAVGVAEQRVHAPPAAALLGQARTWDSRSEIRASSVPEKKPPISTKTTTMTMLSQTSLTGGVLLGVVGWGSPPHGAWWLHGRCTGGAAGVAATANSDDSASLLTHR